MQISDKKVVTIDYTLTNPQGEVLDTSKGRGPLVYLQGGQNIIPGLEDALEGKSTGDELNVTIPPEEGYGEIDEQMIQSVPRSAFPTNPPPTAGMHFEARSPQGTRLVKIVEVDDTNVRVDANHPLAGVTLTFAVKVLDVRDATPEEIAHKHVHGPGGHEH